MDFRSTSAGSVNAAQPVPIDPAAARIARLQADLDRVRAERDALRWAVGHDELTKLPNRRLFQRLAMPLLDDPECESAMIVLDLNGFKPINDLYGHVAGDKVLQAVADRLTAWSGGWPVARLGGDEFAALLTRPRPAAAQWWQPAVNALAAAIAAPILAAQRDLRVHASIGVAATCGPTTLVDALHRADLAMYEQKRAAKRDASVGETTGRHDAHEPADNVLELAIFRKAHRSTHRQPPAEPPSRRDQATVEPATAYQPGDKVWVHREGAWRPGVVETASAQAVMARYRCADGPGTGVDTMSAEYVAIREDVSSPAGKRCSAA